MKKAIYITISILILLSVYFIAGTKRNDIPDLNLLLLDSSTIFRTVNIPGGKPSILIFFSPYCEHCQSETMSILKNMDSLKSVNFYFITIEPLYDMKAFNGYYGLFKYNNITVGKDYQFAFPRYFKDAAPPFSAVYDKSKRLRYVFNGEANAHQFISILRSI